MARWLFKEEPEHYSFDDLRREGSTLWDGVVNALARQYLRQVRRGDRVWYYHTGKEKAIVGEMKVLGDPRPDPTEDDPKAVVVEVKAVRKLPQPVPLTVIKEDPVLASWDLARLPRLSVMPVTDEQWQRVEELARGRTAP